MWVFVKLGVGKSQAEWENAACMNGHRLAPAYRRSTGTCVVAHSLATPGNCNCVCVLYFCFYICICICISKEEEKGQEERRTLFSRRRPLITPLLPTRRVSGTRNQMR